VAEFGRRTGLRIQPWKQGGGSNPPSRTKKAIKDEPIMKVQVEEISPVKKKLMVEVEAEQIRREWDSVAKNFNKKVKLKGFRTGKIPISVLVKYYGPQIDEEVISHVVNQTYPEALKETGLMPVALPELDYPALDREIPFIYKAVIELKPEIPIFEYKGLEVKKSEIAVTEEEVEKRLSAIQLSHGELVSREEERPLRKGDFAVIDYQSFNEGVEIPGGSAKNFDLEVGGGFFNPDFEAALIGLSKEEEKEFDIPFSEDYGNPSLAGKILHYRVKVQEIKERNLPPLDDVFAQSLGKEFASLEDLREKIREDLEKEETRKADLKMKEEIIDQLLSRAEFEVPEAMINQESQRMLMRIEQDLTRQGLDWEKAGLEPARLMEKFRPAAEKMVRKGLLLEKIAALESLSIPPEEIDQELQKIAERVNQSLTLVKEVYSKNNLLEGLSQQLLEEKTLNFLIDQANSVS
jgi:trigger factor